MTIQSVHHSFKHTLSDGDTLLYCTCMMVQSVIPPSINSRKHCVYYIGNVSLTKQTECLPPQLISSK